MIFRDIMHNFVDFPRYPFGAYTKNDKLSNGGSYIDYSNGVSRFTYNRPYTSPAAAITGIYGNGGGDNPWQYTGQTSVNGTFDQVYEVSGSGTAEKDPLLNMNHLRCNQYKRVSDRSDNLSDELKIWTSLSVPNDDPWFNWDASYRFQCFIFMTPNNTYGFPQDHAVLFSKNPRVVDPAQSWSVVDGVVTQPALDLIQQYNDDMKASIGATTHTVDIDLQYDFPAYVSGSFAAENFTGDFNVSGDITINVNEDNIVDFRLLTKADANDIAQNGLGETRNFDTYLNSPTVSEALASSSPTLYYGVLKTSRNLTTSFDADLTMVHTIETEGLYTAGHDGTPETANGYAAFSVGPQSISADNVDHYATVDPTISFRDCTTPNFGLNLVGYKSE